MLCYGSLTPLLISVLVDGIISGGTAGVVVETALYPIDTIKTRLQAGQWSTTYDFHLVLCLNC